MKKMLMLCVTPFILAAIFIVSILCVQTAVTYPFTTKYGDESYLNDISFRVNVMSGNMEQTSGALNIMIHNEDGTSKRTFDYHSYAYETRDSENELMESPTYTKKPDVSYLIEDDSCTTKTEEIDKIPVIYEFIYFQTNMNYTVGDKDYNPFHMNTNLNLINNEQQKLYKETTICSGDESSKYEALKYSNDKKVDQGNIIINGEQQNEFYFMPLTDEYMEGQNAIYKIKLKKSDVGFKYNASSRVIVNLPTDRIYHDMAMLDNSFYIVASMDDSLMMMKYNKDGSLVNEVLLSNKYDKEMVRTETYNNFLMIETGEHIFVYERSSEQLIKCMAKTKEMKNHYIRDIIYKNSLLYVLVDTGENTIENNETEVLHSRNRMEVTLQVLKDATVVYEGVQNIYDSKELDGQQKQFMDMVDASFVRDDV